MVSYSKQLYLLSAEIATTACLETDNDLSELDVPLLLQLSQHTSTEEHLRVPNTIRGRVQVQCLQLYVFRQSELKEHVDPLLAFTLGI